jgi:hypothetical protein
VVKQEVIPVRKAAKRPASWQAYQKKYWTKLKDIVDVEFNKYLENLSKGEKPKPKIQFQTEIVRREYDNETEDVKVEIEKHIQSLKDSTKAESDEQWAMRYQQ